MNTSILLLAYQAPPLVQDCMRPGGAAHLMEATMNDEQDMRMMAAHGAAFAEQMETLLRCVMQAFRVLHCIEWSAPWKKERC